MPEPMREGPVAGTESGISDDFPRSIVDCA